MTATEIPVVPPVSSAQQRVLMMLAQHPAGMKADDPAAAKVSPRTYAALRRRRYATYTLAEGWKITDRGRQVMREQFGPGEVQGVTEYEPHPFEPGGQRDELGRELCPLCGQLAGRRVHTVLDSGRTWS